MRKSIFEKDENGNYILNPDNIDLEYYAKVAQDEKGLLDSAFYLSCFFSFGAFGIAKELEAKRIIDNRYLKYSIAELKRRQIEFSNRYLKKYNPELTDEMTRENFYAILDEYERLSEYLSLYSYLNKPTFDEKDLAKVSEKRDDIAATTTNNAVKEMVLFKLDLTKFILTKKDYDSLIMDDDPANKNKKYRFHYEFLRKQLTVEQIDEARDMILAYKKKHKLSMHQAISELVAYYDLDFCKRTIDSDKRLVDLIFDKEAEYEEDLKHEEERKKEEALRKEREKAEREAAKKKAEFERKQAELARYNRFEVAGMYGPKERVIPLGLNYYFAGGKTIGEAVGEERLNEMFETLKSVPLRRNERIALVIFSDCRKEEALRVLHEMREKALDNGLSDRIIEGIVTEFGEELIFDENNSRPLVPRKAVQEMLEAVKAYNREKMPKLVEEESDKSYLVYSLEKIKGKTKEKDMVKLDKTCRDCIGMIHYITDEEENKMYGIPREKLPSRIRRKIGRFLDFKYSIDKNLLDAFQKSKKLAEYEIDRDDDDGVK